MTKKKIPSLAGKTVAKARAQCEALGLKLTVIVAAPKPDEIDEETELVRHNAAGSEVGAWRESGESVGVILYPFEPTQPDG